MNDAGLVATLPRDRALVNEVAAALLAQFGRDLPEFLRDQIEIAEGNSDELSIQAWSDIRTAAEKLNK